MIHLHFNRRRPLGLNKLLYAQALGLIIKKLLGLKRLIRRLGLEIELDCKIIFK
ncbi:MAG: hypothetical protein JSV30_04535 [Candidatus Omnitrophota bacterium]|nr:MAG: hypothetical protein JSV30_04535 [Candidatus Omnitrophota bacterium]